MEIREEIPEYVFDIYKTTFNKTEHPNIIRTRNITMEGVNMLINKNTLIWSSSVFDKIYVYMEGAISWGKVGVIIYFYKIDNDSTYKVYILTDELKKIDMLMVGLNKFFTIDKL